MKKILGKESLQNTFPQLMNEWDYDKNDSLPCNYMPKSNKKVWWKCDKGHEWMAVIASRTAGCGCPYCSNRKVLPGYNDLLTTNPEVNSIWDYNKNTILPNEVTSGSNRKVWWKCSVGHSFQVSIHDKVNRNKGFDCPFCSNKKLLKGFNDLATVYPDLASEWDSLKNNITPDRVLPGGHKKVWWKCKKGHTWKNSLTTRIRQNIGCPYCSGRYAVIGKTDLLSQKPYLAIEWDYDKNTIEPTDVTCFSDKEVWWKCAVCGNSWKTKIKSRSKGNGCPACSKAYRTSLPEQALFYYIKQIFSDAINSYKPEWIKNSSEIDIYIPEISVGIEYDGQNWHKNIEKDIQKNNLCMENNIYLLRIRERGCPPLPSSVPCIFVDNTLNNEESITDLIKIVLTVLCVSEAYIKNISFHQDFPDILSSYEGNKKEKSLSNKFPDIAIDWNYKKNKGLKPENITYSSNKKVWWKCKLGHEWEASVNNRIKRGCPFCSNKKLLKGFNDLATVYPDLASEWDYELNKNIKPDMITPGAEVKVWWKCNKCGHSFQMFPYARKKGRGCPICAGKLVVPGFNDIESLFPDLMKEWDYDLNEMLPSLISKGSMKAVWWKCKNCNHQWKTAVRNRTTLNSGCPICSRKRAAEKLKKKRV